MCRQLCAGGLQAAVASRDAWFRDAWFDVASQESLPAFVAPTVIAPTVIALSVETTVFDFSWGHLLAVAVVALIVIGPKELPSVLRTVGQWTTKIRRMAAEFQGQFQEALREAEMADLKKEIDSFSDTARGFTTQISDSLNVQDATKWEPAAQNKPDATAETTTVEPAPAGNPAADAGVSPEPAATAEAAAADAPPAAALGAIEFAAGANAAADTLAPAAAAPSLDAGPAKGAPIHDS